MMAEPGIVKIGMNNSALIIKPNYWISSDEPACFSREIIYDQSYWKFGGYSRCDSRIDGKPWKYYPSTFFYGVDQRFDYNNFLFKRKEFVWWKNTWFIALQFAYRLGFRTIYSIGSEFKISKESQYAFGSNLTDKEIDINALLYTQTIERMEKLKPHFEECKLRFVSCSKASPLADIFEYLDPEQAVIRCTTQVPIEQDPSSLPHSKTLHEKTRASTGNNQ